MKVSPKTTTVGSITKKVSRGDVSLKHKLQRKEGVWTKPAKSLLIDSLLRNYRVPEISLVLDPIDNKKYALDGVQRLSTFRDYIDDKFALSSGLDPIIIGEKTYEISKKKFSKLDEELQEHIKDTNIVIYEISDYTDKEIRDMFSRLNAGKPLNATQKLTILMSDNLIESVNAILNNKVFDMLLTNAQMSSSADLAIVIETMMLMNSSKEKEFISFTIDDKKKFVLWLNNNLDQQKVEMINDSLTILGNFIESNKGLGIQKTSIPMVIYSIYRVKKDKKSMDKLLNKVKDFILTYDTNDKYKESLKNGTTSASSVKKRFDYWKDIIRTL